MKLVNIFTLLVLVCFLSGCGCDNEPPSVTLKNSSPAKASIQIKTSNGNTENINNVDPGWQSDRRTFAAGNIEFTVSIQGVTDPVVYSILISNCTDYVVSVNPDSTVTSSHVDRD